MKERKLLAYHYHIQIKDSAKQFFLTFIYYAFINTLYLVASNNICYKRAFVTHFSIEFFRSKATVKLFV